MQDGTYDTVCRVDARHLLELFEDVAADVRVRIEQATDTGLTGAREGQYAFDVIADDVVTDRLVAEGLGVMSEESGVHGAGRAVMVVVDPVDGSTNAAAGLPWYATSLCAVDADGPLASLVVNQATGDRYSAIRGDGALRNGSPIAPSGVAAMSDAFVAVSGLPDRNFGWRQFRCYGAAALDICAVADGTFDAFADLSVDAHGAWDYLGAWLVCQEAGVPIVDLRGRQLVTVEHHDRRTPIAAATPELLTELLQAVLS